MGRRKFEDVFEECLSALLEGRRSIEESLSLYPSLAKQLGPLLESAAEVTAGFDQGIPAGRLERGRQRFLEEAAVRLRRQQPGLRAAQSWWRWGVVVGAAATGLGVLALVNATLMDGGGGGGLQGPVSVRVLTPTPSTPANGLAAPLEQAQEQVARLESAVEQGGPVEPSVIQELQETNRQIAARLDDPSALEGQRRAAVKTLASTLVLLSRARGLVCGIEVQEVNEAIEATEAALEKLGGSPEPGVSPTARATPTFTPTPTTSPTAQASPTAPGVSSTPQPCPTASPTPSGSPAGQSSPTPGSTPQP